MNKQNINSILIVFSIIVLLYYIIIVTNSILISNKINFIDFNLLFGNIIVLSIFVINNLVSYNTQIKKIYKYLLTFLLIISVIFSGVLVNEFIVNGLFNRHDVFWKITTAILAISSIILIQFSQQKWLNK